MKRLLTAAVALPILLYAVWSSAPYFFAILAALAALVGVYEFYKLASSCGCNPHRIAGYFTTLALMGSFYWRKPELIAGVLGGLVMISLVQSVFRPEEIKTALVSVAATTFGVLYVGLLVGFLVGARLVENVRVDNLAPKMLTLFFALTMMTDTGAYYVGRSLGRKKLAPRVSPGKTVEGSIGGFLTAIATGLVSRWIFFPEIPLVDVVLLGAVIGVVGQLGDLAESMLKRAADVKDSSALFPGHGGMLDRLDSLLFGAPVIYLYSIVLFER
jgi:phosphatidate cytidylyltransferase